MGTKTKNTFPARHVTHLPGTKTKNTFPVRHVTHLPGTKTKNTFPARHIIHLPGTKTTFPVLPLFTCPGPKPRNFSSPTIVHLPGTKTKKLFQSNHCSPARHKVRQGNTLLEDRNKKGHFSKKS